MNVLVADGVWKSYPRWRPGSRSLRSVLSPTMRGARRSKDTRWALRDVSFSLAEGNAIGIIGHNGAGKSTLLRLASGLSQPTCGSLRVAPATASVLSLGATFNADLTGAANAVTAAVIGGLTPQQAREQLPRAIDFAELHGFEDAPVRAYSEGMKLRLAFGVLTLLHPQLLLLDEVMAVGDLGFQTKCMAHLDKLREGGTAIVLVSHDLAQIADQCDQALLLGNGEVKAIGETQEIIEEYELAVQNETLRLTPESGGDEERGSDLVLQENRFGSQQVTIDRVVVGAPGRPGEVATGGRLDVAITLNPVSGSPLVHVAVEIERQEDEVKCVDLNTDLDELTLDPTAGPIDLTLSLDALELRPGRYWVDVGVFPHGWSHAFDFHYHAYPLTVTGVSDDDGAVFRPQQRRWTVHQ